MKLYTNAKILAVETNNFSDEQGRTIEFYTNFIKDEEGAVLKINSGKEDFSKYEGKTGVLGIEIREQNGQIKAKLVSVGEDLEDEIE